MDKAFCKVCALVRTKINSGRKNRGGTWFIDQNGRLWRGRTCPSCFSKTKKKARLIKRGGEELIGPELETNPLTIRRCRRCDTLLTKDRYFSCSQCGFYKTEYWDMSEEYHYHG